MAFVDRANFPSLVRPEAHQHHGSELVKGSVTADQLAAASVTAAKLASEAWLTWSPTLTNITVGNGSQVARYVRLGRTIHFNWSLVFGTTTTIAGAASFSLPVTPQSTSLGDGPWAHVSYLDAAANVMLGQGHLAAGSSNVQLRAWLSSGTYVTFTDVSATVPFTWGNDDVIQARGTYEAAV